MDIPLFAHLALHDEPDGQGDIGAGVHRQAGVNGGGAGHHDGVETGDDLSCGGSCWLVAASQAAETHYKEVKVVTGGQGEAGDLAAGQVGDQEIRRYDRERGVRQEVRG